MKNIGGVILSMDLKRSIKHIRMKNAAFVFFALMLAGVFAGVSVSFDLFHNHDADHADHPECPVHQLTAILNAACVICAILFFSCFYPVAQLVLNSIHFVTSFHPFHNLIRGPPVLR